ncbi:PepSY-associated TM helix domain-containing protein [Pseudaestuariivita rosea]|uniref:PepSY-associated TM helix domain-containing protein n=1 Tax=Pseudaestuariivita rosea TaxID=2763263 RepID=UPI001ABB68D2|nr:PepSY-associated TM helix domain-containing protein [Pseudaestuariivita rosea]
MNASAASTKRLVALHGWSATVLAVLLYVVMLTGTIVVFDNEITRWSEGRTGLVNALDGPVDVHIRRLAEQVPDDLEDDVIVREGRGGNLSVFFGANRVLESGESGLFGHSFLIDPRSGTLHQAKVGFFADIIADRPEYALSNFLVDLHVRLHVPGRLGLYMTGILGVIMLIAAVTGVLIHKHIVRDLFTTERPGKRIVSFRDRHTLAGVWSLPFAILLSFTGAFLSFAVSLGLPVVALVAFGGDQDKALETVMGSHAIVDPTPARMADLQQIISDAQGRANMPIGGLTIHHYGRADAIVETAHSAVSSALRGKTFEYSASTGEFLREVRLVGTDHSAGSTLAELMTPLHFGNFAGLTSRLVWAALGAAMTYTIISGMQLWLRRRQDDPIWRAGDRVLTTVAWGLPLAIVGTAYVFLLTYLADDPIYWTPRAFVVICVLIILIGFLTRKLSNQIISRYYCGSLGIGLLVLPFFRLQTGGLSWGEAVLWRGHDVLLIDTFCILMGIVFAVSAQRSYATRLQSHQKSQA